MEALRTTKYTKKIDGWTMFSGRHNNAWISILQEILADSMTTRFKEVMDSYAKKKSQKQIGVEIRDRIKKHILHC